MRHIMFHCEGKLNVVHAHCLVTASFSVLLTLDIVLNLDGVRSGLQITRKLTHLH